MKSLEDQDHYEILEVQRGAGQEEIERAYRITRAAYADESLALYSIYSEQDAASIRERIDEAYRALTDSAEAEETRDTREDGRSSLDSPTRVTSASYDEFEELEFARPRPRKPESFSASAVELPSAIDVFEDLDAGVEEDTQDFDGAGLRRARLRRGIELDQIATVTKVGTTYLRCIEEEAFEDLPAAVYVRGFVTAYARAIGLDPKRVASSYMPRLEEARNGRRRPGLLGRN